MKKPLRDQINELGAMSVTELEKQHLQLFGEEPPSSHRQFLLRKIAWRLQADREGGLPESARQLARAIAKDAPLRNRVISNAGKRRAGFPIDQSATTTITPGHDSRLPMPGGLIVKKYKVEARLLAATLEILWRSAGGLACPLLRSGQGNNAAGAPAQGAPEVSGAEALAAD